MRIKRSGAVLEPFSGAFDVTVAPGEGVQAAVDACPRGGCVLLLPGIHEGPLVLSADQEVHVFGRERARLWTTAGNALTSSATQATLDGLVIQQGGVLIDGDDFSDADGFGVRIAGGAMRFQNCSITSSMNSCMFIDGGSDTDPVLVGCTCVGLRCFRGLGGCVLARV